MSMEVVSQAFGQNEPIPSRYTADGEDLSPPLKWSGVPEEAKELALICDDPDAPRALPWVHWVIYKIPDDVTGLDEGVPTSPRPSSPAGAMQGINNFGNPGYGGPAPPRGNGPHHYRFHLYALDTELDLQSEMEARNLRDAIKGHVIAEGELVGTYQR